MIIKMTTLIKSISIVVILIHLSSQQQQQENIGEIVSLNELSKSIYIC